MASSPPRRLRKAVTEDAVAGAAGLKSSKMPHLQKGMASKSRGPAPSDHKEWQFRPTKQFVSGRSFAGEGALLKHEGESSSPTGRTSLRLAPQSFTTALAPGSGAVLEEPRPFKPARRPATAAPRTDRVLGVPGESEDAQASAPTYALLATAKRDVFVTSRPMTAPSCVLRSKPQLRTGFATGRGCAADVIGYRHSGGICPADYTLVTERPPAPQVERSSAQATRAAFFDARSCYMNNKMRALASDVLAH